MARDWPADLWPSSFRGVPFWTERDEDGFGKRLVVHEFVGRDDPFIEDLGAKARTFDFTAYLVGDVSDAESDRLVAALMTAGPGVLVLPAQGPVTGRFHQGKRDRSKDKMGYFAFQMQFYREGTARALAPVNFLAQLVHDATGALQSAAATLLDRVTLQ